jgi:hypothetical protein
VALVGENTSPPFSTLGLRHGPLLSKYGFHFASRWLKERCDGYKSKRWTKVREIKQEGLRESTQ